MLLVFVTFVIDDSWSIAAHTIIYKKFTTEDNIQNLQQKTIFKIYNRRQYLKFTTEDNIQNLQQKTIFKIYNRRQYSKLTKEDNKFE